MVRPVFMLLVACVFNAAHAQYFSGELNYAFSIIAKGPNINADSLMALHPGTEMTYRITDGYYKTSYFRDGKETYSYIYHGDTKRMYDASADKDYITYRDSRKGNTRLIRSVVLKDSVKMIAGHRCIVVERVYERYIAKTYYAEDLRINFGSFADHAAGAWYEQIKEMDGRLSLGSINEYADYIEVNRVVSITPKTLSAGDFTLPQKIIVASAEALDKPVDLKPLSPSSLYCYRKSLQEAGAAKPFTSVIGFILSETGKISHIEPYQKDDQGLHQIAERIISTCGLEFIPGEIAGTPVSSWVYFPVEFGR